jgi:tight adherence protein C
VILLLASLALVALAIGIVVGTIATANHGSTGVARSLELINYRPDRRSVARSELATRDRLINPLTEGFKAMGHRISPAGTTERIAISLNKAGNPPAWPLDRIFLAKGLGIPVGVVLGLLYGGFSLKGIVAAAVAATALFLLPDLLVYNAGLRRQEELRKGLAEALDMLTVCVEAGQGFDGGLMQVARTVTGPISGEFARVLSEIQIGKTRGEAFSAMAERATAPEVKNFVSALVQADRLGLPIGVVLREQTKEMRLVRRQRAEEQAQKVTVKVIFPVMLCIFPVIFIVLLGPAAIKIVRAFTGQW